MMEMNKKGEKARLVHKSFFDKCNSAIDQGYYLEAMCMEYAAIEARMIVIMRSIGMPCGIKKESKEQPDIPITQRLKCLKCFLKDKAVFSNSYFESEKEIDDILLWIKYRNNRIHALYSDTEKYDQMISNNKKLAILGLKYARTMYDEANRLKRICSKKDKLKYFNGRCHCEKNKNCLKLNQFIKEYRNG